MTCGSLGLVYLRIGKNWGEGGEKRTKRGGERERRKKRREWSTWRQDEWKHCCTAHDAKSTALPLDKCTNKYTNAEQSDSQLSHSGRIWGQYSKSYLPEVDTDFTFISLSLFLLCVFVLDAHHMSKLDTRCISMHNTMKCLERCKWSFYLSYSGYIRLNPVNLSHLFSFFFLFFFLIHLLPWAGESICFYFIVWMFKMQSNINCRNGYFCYKVEWKMYKTTHTLLFKCEWQCVIIYTFLSTTWVTSYIKIRENKTSVTLTCYRCFTLPHWSTMTASQYTVQLCNSSHTLAGNLLNCSQVDTWDSLHSVVKDNCTLQSTLCLSFYCTSYTDTHTTERK